MRSYLRITVLAFIILIGDFIAWQMNLWPADFGGYLLQSVLFFYGLSLLVVFLSAKGIRSGKFGTFSLFFLGAIGLKFVLSVAGFTGFILLLHANGRIFIFPFLGVYLVFTIFETIELLHINKRVST